MAKKIRFPLQMNGADVRTIEELRENFDLESVLGYFANGKLVIWLRNRYYDNEAMAVEALSANDSELNQKLMSILGVSADENAEEIDIKTIQRRNEKLMLLRQITDDKEIIDNVDCVAFHQEELNQLLKEGKKKIYLCQGEFEIPICEADITYTGISNPTVSIVVDDGSNMKLGNVVLNHIKCTSDSSDILLQLGMSYKNGDGVEQDYTKAVEYLKKAAELGNAEAQFQLGMRYKNGDGVEKDEVKAIEYLKKAAELGNVEAQFQLGMYYKNKFLLEVYEDRDEAERDYSKAVAYLEKVAEHGDARAQCNLGECYYYNCNGFTANYAEAVKWYYKAAEQGDMKAQRGLGNCYHFGHGIKEDCTEAVKWYRKAVEQGDAYAMYWIGSCYHRGGNGINKNYAEAVKWYCKALEHGEKCASDIGDCYQEGGYGLNRNYTEARKWYRKALETGEIVPVYFSARGIASEAIP